MGGVLELGCPHNHHQREGEGEGGRGFISVKECFQALQSVLSFVDLAKRCDV